jgi:hypothetical protein
VNILIFVPEKSDQYENEYHCKFSIMGGGINYSGKSIGFDSMQALILSLKKIGTFLTQSDDLDTSLMKWEGGPMDFPVFKNV